MEKKKLKTCSIELPDDCIINIMKYLERKSLLSFLLSSKKMYKVYKDNIRTTDQKLLLNRLNDMEKRRKVDVIDVYKNGNDCPLINGLTSKEELKKYIQKKLDRYDKDLKVLINEIMSINDTFYLSGGFLYSALKDGNAEFSDIDLFLIIPPKDITFIKMEIYKCIEKFTSIGKKKEIYFTKRLIEIHINKKKIQLILFTDDTKIDDILLGFDIDSLKFALNNESLYGTVSGISSFNNNINILEIRNLSSETKIYRIKKYIKRGMIFFVNVEPAANLFDENEMTTYAKHELKKTRERYLIELNKYFEDDYLRKEYCRDNNDIYFFDGKIKRFDNVSLPQNPRTLYFADTEICHYLSYYYGIFSFDKIFKTFRECKDMDPINYDMQDNCNIILSDQTKNLKLLLCNDERMINNLQYDETNNRMYFNINHLVYHYADDTLINSTIKNIILDYYDSSSINKNFINFMKRRGIIYCDNCGKYVLSTDMKYQKETIKLKGRFINDTDFASKYKMLCCKKMIYVCVIKSEEYKQVESGFILNN